ncbi:hypothetical protein CDAR_228791 [Caerostris darwini]|uniref:Uncharacterized protein n=1 Tax=Caerostris darwini TaxID=1538125 RepID=A0AAV4PE35_9ARAC|nr:hypothetical protein CDAR_228791 [Caerostris darwini]
MSNLLEESQLIFPHKKVTSLAARGEDLFHPQFSNFPIKKGTSRDGFRLTLSYLYNQKKKASPLSSLGCLKHASLLIWEVQKLSSLRTGSLSSDTCNEMLPFKSRKGAEVYFCRVAFTVQ